MMWLVSGWDDAGDGRVRENEFEIELAPSFGKFLYPLGDYLAICLLK